MEYDYVAGILKKCRDMVTKLNKSNVIRLSYQSYLKEFDLPSITPGTDCSTRWGSTFQMSCDFLNTRAAFDRLCETYQLELIDEEEVRALNALRAFLDPYYALTKMVCCPPAQKWYALQTPLLSYSDWRQTAFVRNRKNAGGHTFTKRLFGKSLLEKTAKQFSTWFSDETIRIATLLDSRFALLENILSNDDWWECMSEDRGQKRFS